MAQQNITPERDASLGLIYRLNNLWSKVDYFAEHGNYDRWNWLLDRIYVNLQYRNPMVKVTNKKTGKIMYKVPMKDARVYKYFSQEIAKVRKDFLNNRNPRLKSKLRNLYYSRLQEKDIWLRKLMMDLRLYLKESEKRPGTSVYGTFGGSR